MYYKRAAFNLVMVFTRWMTWRLQKQLTSSVYCIF